MAGEAGSGNKVGEAYVELHARMDKLQADLNAAQHQVTTFAGVTKQEAERARTAFESVESGVKSLRQALQFVAMPLAVLNTAERLVSLLSDAEARSQAFAKSIEGISQSPFLKELADKDPVARIMQERSKKIDEITEKLEAQKKIDYAPSNILSNILEGETAVTAFQRHRKEAAQEIAEVEKNTIDEIRIAKEKAAAETAKKDAEERAKLEEKAKREQEIIEAKSAREAEAAAKQLQREEDQLREREQREIESAKRIAASIADAQADFGRRITESISSSFRQALGQITASVEQIGTLIVQAVNNSRN